MRSIIAVRRGWDPAQGDCFYPDDLPPEWRLTYFANALTAVLLPFDQWRGADASQWHQWSLDVPPRFRFFVEAGHGIPDSPTWSALSEGLGEHLAGVVAASPLAWADPCYLRVQASGCCDVIPGSVRLAWEAPAELYADPRGARSWLESVLARSTERSVLILMGEAAPEVVLRWQMLADLLAG